MGEWDGRRRTARLERGADVAGYRRHGCVTVDVEGDPVAGSQDQEEREGGGSMAHAGESIQEPRRRTSRLRRTSSRLRFAEAAQEQMGQASRS